MKQNKKYTVYYPVVAILSLLLLKLALTGLFVCSKEDTLPIRFQSQTAVAAETAEQGGTKKDSAESRLNQGAQKSQQELQKDVTRTSVVERKRFELEIEQRRIQREREQLLVLQKEIDKKLIELSKLQDDLKETVTKKSAAHKQKIKHLIKVYTSMSPKKAAVLIEKLDINIIIEIFSAMKGDSVGKILSYVKPAKAAVISERLIKR